MAGYKKGKAIRLSYNFKSTEFDCKGVNCCSTTLIDKELVIYLQRIRNYFKAAVIVNSGYRCGKHNKAVGGSKGSRHLIGSAADIRVKGVKPIEVARYCEAIGIKGIGLYDTFCHIDTRQTKYYWYSHKQIKRNSFK